MKLSDFDYILDPDLIAQEPASLRDHSRLMVVDRRSGEIRHKRFYEITDFLRRGDLLVLNDTQVIRARLQARKETGGQVEIFLLRDRGENKWEALIRGKVSEGAALILESGHKAVVEKTLQQSKRLIRFDMEQDLYEYMERYGAVPLPPYIRRNGDLSVHELDRERYQTVYSRTPGAVAAPTAGLHFTDGLLSRAQEKGIQIVNITLHVGYGTFKPVIVEHIRDHRMDEEHYSIGEDAAKVIRNALNEGRRVIAVGTTSTRALESATDQVLTLSRFSGSTDLFITPGYRFKAIQGLITNFHLPKSTLLMLVAAFMGKELMDRVYEEAKENDYRFYSYGDAMFVV